ncbi:MAG: tyrosine-type recombinase/integrase [Candidatus Latescibacterota bacterium]
MKPRTPTTLAVALRTFFAEHLPLSRGLSPNTVKSYRDAIVLLLRFLAEHHGCDVVDLDVAHLGPDELVAFLDHLESDRGNGTSSRNARLAAVRSFARYFAAHHPESLELCQRLLAVPVKRGPTRTVDYLEGDEFRAMFDAASKSLRDRALLLTLLNTGARVSELLGICVADLELERPLQVHLFGKGRKERVCPLWPRTADALRALCEQIGPAPSSRDRVFRNLRGEPLTRFGARHILRKYARLAQDSAPSLSRKSVHPHQLRHTAAVQLLQAGVDLVTISQWLGHASVETTNRYLVVDLEAKRAALEKARPFMEPAPDLTTWRTDASVLAWLEAL